MEGDLGEQNFATRVGSTLYLWLRTWGRQGTPAALGRYSAGKWAAPEVDKRAASEVEGGTVAGKTPERRQTATAPPLPGGTAVAARHT